MSSEATKPSVWRRARWNTVLKVNAVTIARSEYLHCHRGITYDFTDVTCWLRSSSHLEYTAWDFVNRPGISGDYSI